LRLPRRRSLFCRFVIAGRLPARLTPAAATSTARSARSARTTAAATATTALRTGTSFVDSQSATFELALIEPIDRALSVLVRSHFHEREPARAARGLVTHHAHRLHGAERRKELFQLGLSCRVWQVANK
jgi:hypothetical protein